jgi:hypothetical protein
VVRFLSHTDNPGVRVWLGGKPVKHQGRYRVARGEYTLLAELAAGKNPIAEDLCLDVQFVPAAPTAAGDVKAYRRALEEARPHLERVVELAPESDAARRAKGFLKRME